jgi:hypothetical protein
VCTYRFRVEKLNPDKKNSTGAFEHNQDNVKDSECPGFLEKKKEKKRKDMKTKKIGIILSACLAVLSCVSEHDLPTPEKKKEEITFIATDSRNSDLRAAPSDLGALNDFRVFGALLPQGAIENYTDTAFMPGIRVHKFDGVWSYAPVKQLPSAPAAVKYWAYSPATSLFASNFQGGDGEEATLDYQVPEEITRMEDLLVAKTGALTSENVALDFAHPLAQINFSAKGNNEANTYTVEQIGLLNWKDRGTLKLSDNTWTIADDASPVSYDNLLTSPLLVNAGTDADYTPLTNGNQNTALFILPGATTKPDGTEITDLPEDDKSYLLVKYSAKNATGDELNIFADLTAYYPIGDAQFEVGKQTT